MTRVLEELERQLRPEALLGLLAATVVLTLLGGWLYVFKPSLAQVKDLATRRTHTLAEAEAQIAASAAAVAAAERELAALRERLHGEASAVPRAEMESWVVDRMYGISQRRGVRLLGVSPAAPGSFLGFDELPFEVDVVGDYFGLFDWLVDVEEELRPLVVQQFALGHTKNDGGVQMSLRIVSYRPPPEAP